MSKFFLGLCTIAIVVSGCSTPVNYRSTEEISVKDFGAVGDGVANDTQSFAQAFEACAKNNGINKIVIPAGFYLLDSLVIKGFQGLVVEGGGSYHTRLVSTGLAKRFFQVGMEAGSKKMLQALSVKHCRLEGFRIEGKSNARIGMHVANAQDNLFQRIEVNGFETNLKIEYSWINTFRHFRLMNYRKFGLFMEGNGLNANLFESCRTTSQERKAVAYRVAGNSSTFLNCTAEGLGTGWEFQYCRKSNLIGCHSEINFPFRLLKKVGQISIEGHFIWKPESVWDLRSKAKAESISMRNCYIYSPDAKKTIGTIPAVNRVSDGNLQSKTY